MDHLRRYLPESLLPANVGGRVALAGTVGLFGLITWKMLIPYAVGRYQLRHVPIPYTAHLVKGHLAEMISAEDSLAATLAWYKEYRRPFAVRLMWEWRLLVWDPEDLRFILSQPRRFTKDMPLYRRLGRLLGKHGLVTVVDEDAHARSRAVLGPAFSPTVLRELATTIFVDEASELVIQIGAVASTSATDGVHIQELLSEAAMRVVTASVFALEGEAAAAALKLEGAKGKGAAPTTTPAPTAAAATKVSSREALELGRMFKRVIQKQKLSIETMLISIFPVLGNIPFLPSVKSANEAREGVRKLVASVLSRVSGSEVVVGGGGAVRSRSGSRTHVVGAKGGADGVEVGEAGGEAAALEDSTAPNTFCRTVAIALQGGKVTLEEVRDQIMTLVFAGHETTAGAVTWALALLALPENRAHLERAVRAAEGFETNFAQRIKEEGLAATSVASTLQTEVNAAATPVSRLEESVQSGRHLLSVCKEVLRISSPVPLVARRASNEEVVLPSGQRVPPGMILSLCTYLTHRLPAWGEDAAVFDPTRWEDPTRMPTDPYLYTPFLHGKRNCIGRDFAMKEFAILLSAVLRNFDISYPPGAERPKATLAITMQPRTPLRLIMTPRKAM